VLSLANMIDDRIGLYPSDFYVSIYNMKGHLKDCKVTDDESVMWLTGRIRALEKC